MSHLLKLITVIKDTKNKTKNSNKRNKKNKNI